MENKILNSNVQRLFVLCGGYSPEAILRYVPHERDYSGCFLREAGPHDRWNAECVLYTDANAFLQVQEASETV